ncbi:MAG: hypothetical protein PHS95_00385 [Candidatus Pacebacteria bacterium]|nr:hypothetical protein [Candidatus Paceibacterota bacterium]
METVKNPKSFFKWFGLAGTGWLVLWLTDHWFEYVLYPIAIEIGGMLYGGLFMVTVSFLGTWAQFIVYDWMGKDLLGFEKMKSWKFVAWFLKKEGSHKIDTLKTALGVLVLSIYIEPFKLTLLFRRGSYSGLSRRDWGVFIAGVIVSNTSWTLLVTGVLKIIHFLFGLN